MTWVSVWAEVGVGVRVEEAVMATPPVMVVMSVPLSHDTPPPDPGVPEGGEGDEW